MKKRIMTLILAGVIAASTAAAVSAEEAAPAAGVVFTAESGYVASTYTGTVAADVGITAGELLGKLEDANGISVVRADAALGADEAVKSGDKVVLVKEDGSVKSEFSVMFMGDANSDSKLNIGDASAMLKKVAKWDVTIDAMAADVDGNGAVNLSDVSSILKVLAKWDAKFVNTPTIPGKIDLVYYKYDECFNRSLNASFNPVCLSDGVHYDLGVKFNVAEGKNATKLDFHCPSFAEDKGSLTISVYKWDGDYNSSISAMPIVSKKFVDFKDNTYLTLDVTDPSGKGLVEGEYVWRIHDGVDKEGNGVGIYFYSSAAPAESTGMLTFLNCKAFNIGPAARIYYSNVQG